MCATGNQEGGEDGRKERKKGRSNYIYILLCYVYVCLLVEYVCMWY